ncbi:non-hydrolyzing UDP-N-acetylglucosamine 2-epimerase [Alloalcanivorax xenomutans]|uniref:non-hydrolyzing UDP-N-acetylglucosamine 2-epimerase n=1 Tax=Alloalcanivorax xenomutans TaxID=1094342 RepID=UPI000BE21F21|nr:UDP-N-acetylglucosamine 2-epimerase (non-hydrolyzing) [Alloalcanivorax xenomutans]
MNVLIVSGTRPEAIKMAPVIEQIRLQDTLQGKVCVTGQHREMLDHVLSLFGIIPDYDLNVMRRPWQTLSAMVSCILEGLDDVISDCHPDLVMVHGDTSTTMAATLAAFHHGVAVAHVEAGLRTGDLTAPWPEEGNRKVVASLASLHFAPTEGAARNLSDENTPAEKSLVTGNTVIDALLTVRDMQEQDPLSISEFKRKYNFIHDDKKVLLVTGHRRESFGEGFQRICDSVRILAKMNPNVDIVYPVHLNPNVTGPVRKHLSGLDNVHLIEPQDYFPFVYLMNRADVILTDSGGIQEEALSLGKPVLVMRDTTERPEAVAAGTVRLVGTNVDRIVTGVHELLNDHFVLERMASAHNPYGDGRAAGRIVKHLLAWRDGESLEKR